MCYKILDVFNILRTVCLQIGAKAKLKAGTIEIATGSQIFGSISHANLLLPIQHARKPYGNENHKKLAHWLTTNTSERQIIAYCGLLMSIFDFDRKDYEEKLDTIEPVFTDFASFPRIPNCTLTSITKDERKKMFIKKSIIPILILLGFVCTTAFSLEKPKYYVDTSGSDDSNC